MKQEQYLFELFDKINIPRAVYDELCDYQGYVNGKTYKQIIDNYCADNKIHIDELTIGDYYEKSFLTNDFTTSKVIGEGEAEAIILAKKNNGVLASNNLRDVKFYVEKFGLKHITTSDIICELYQRHIINFNTANGLWDRLYNYYNNAFMMPCDKFLKYYGNWDSTVA